jgi:hypothetical protein
VRVLLTGAGGFVGGAVARLLRERGDTVLAPVRDPAKVRELARLGVELATSDLSDVDELVELLRGADAVIHTAGSYRVGIARGARGAMWDANRHDDAHPRRHIDGGYGAGRLCLDGQRVRQHAWAGRRRVVPTRPDPRVPELVRRDQVPRPRARRATDSRRRPDRDRHAQPGLRTRRSFRVRRSAAARIRASSPIPGARRRRRRPRPRRRPGGRDRGRARPGTAGPLLCPFGTTTTLRDAITTTARIGGRRPPRIRIPTRVLRAAARLGSTLGRPGMLELVDASAGVTYWASSARARQELGFSARPIENGLRDIGSWQ